MGTIMDAGILGVYQTEEVLKLKKETIFIENPDISLALKFLSESLNLKIDNPEETLFFENAYYFDVNKKHKFSKLTPYSFLKLKKETFWPLLDSFQHKNISFSLYDYLKEKGYSDKAILRVNPNYIKCIPEPDLDLYVFALKILKKLGAKNHHQKIEIISQKSVFFNSLFSIDEDLKLLENKIKVLNTINYL